MFSALEEIEFESFIQPLRDSLELFRTAAKEKKASKTNGNKSATETTMEEDVHESNMGTETEA